MKKAHYNLTFLLTVLMSVVGTKASAHDIEVANADDVTIYYVWNSNKTELSVSYRGNEHHTFEDEYSGNVVIPSSVTYDGKEYSVKSIGKSAFAGCSGLTSVTIPKSVKSIGSDAFLDCPALTSVEINSNIILTNNISMSISPLHIFGSQVQKYTFGNDVTSIGEWAFSGCESLTSVEIPSGVISIGTSAFCGCSSLTKIEVASGNAKYDSRDNCNAIIETASNTLIAGCQNTIIPNSVTSIGRYAFESSSLTSVEIPNSVKSIGYGAFFCCYGLTSATIGNSVTSIDEDAFSWCSSLTSVTIPNSVTSIGDGAFANCYDLTSVEIPNSVTSIGERVFKECPSLTSVTIPNSVTTIGEEAFRDCSALTSATIGNSVKSIGYATFYGCSSLTSVTIGSGVTSFDHGVFYDCTKVTKLTCLATTPPQCTAYTFDGIDKEKCTLIVPAGSIADYKAANQWKDFLIIEEAPTGINQTHIDNALPGRQYDASGSRIAAPQRGINIIKSSDGTTKKVLVK